jgi:hypothetical protein
MTMVLADKPTGTPKQPVPSTDKDKSVKPTKSKENSVHSNIKEDPSLPNAGSHYKDVTFGIESTLDE